MIYVITNLIQYPARITETRRNKIKYDGGKPKLSFCPAEITSSIAGGRVWNNKI